MLALAGEIEPFVALVRDGSANAAVGAASALAKISSDNTENRVAIARAGAIEPLRALVRGGSARSQNAAALLLGRIAPERFSVTLLPPLLPVVASVLLAAAVAFGVGVRWRHPWWDARPKGAKRPRAKRKQADNARAEVGAAKHKAAAKAGAGAIAAAEDAAAAAETQAAKAEKAATAAKAAATAKAASKATATKAAAEKAAAKAAAVKAAAERAAARAAAETAVAGGATALVAVAGAAAVPVELDPQPSLPAAVTSLSNAQFDTGRPEAPESTIGGQTTCIICFVNPKSHLAAPCGHQCACGACSARLRECPVCRASVVSWLRVRMA